MLSKEEYTSDYIKDKLRTDKSWQKRALIRLYQCQTELEKVSQHTKESNNVGFNSFDAPILSKITEALLKSGKLPDNKCLSKLLPKYHRQIREFIFEK